MYNRYQIKLARGRLELKRMNLLNKNGSKSPLASLAALSIFLLFITLFSQIFSQKVYSDALYLQEGWSITHNGKTLDDVDLSKYIFPTLHRGDEITLRTTLPQPTFSSTHMQLRVWHSTIDISVDGESIFSYGHEALAQKLPVGGGYQWIPLPQDIGGKELEIRLYVTEYKSFTQIVPPMLYPSAEMVRDFVRQNSPMATIGLFLTALGLIVLLFAAVLLRFRRDALQLLWIALLALVIGMWVLCRYGVFQLVSTSPQLNYYMEYVCLYLAAPLGLLCVYSIGEVHSKVSPLTKVLFALQLLYVPILLALDRLHIISIAEALPICHGFILVSSIFIFCYCFRRRHNTAERIKLLGVTLLTVFSVADLLLFLWDSVVPHASIALRYSLAAIGAVLFILFLLINYGLNSVHHFYAKAETTALKKMAYTDPLTGLFNRAKSNETMLQMDSDLAQPWGMVLFDLNYLKETNDKLGHTAGDTLICAFAAILRDNFSPLGTVARIGGDEFIALFSANDSRRAEEALEKLCQQIEAYNASGPTAAISVAHGWANSSDIPQWDSEKLYRLADERMYAHKAQMKGLAPQAPFPDPGTGANPD